MGIPAGPGSALSTEVSVQDRNALPQYGFGPEVEFDKLVSSNPFLFRVHTPRELSPFYDRTDPYFVGPRFEEDFASSSFSSQSESSPFRSPPAPSYADAVQHMDWTSRSSSPYVSTSFSFAWAIWEATRRYHHNMKHSIEIAIIDARAVAGRAVTAVELLRQADAKDRHTDHWKWYRFALEAQDVLVWGYVPGTAVLASVPLTQMFTKLPSYFLLPDAPTPTNGKDTSLSRLAWDYTRKKPSYRQFCQEMSDRFLRMPVDRRMRDTTAGSVRLALCHLRPWFHRLALEDFTTATVTACELAFVIARWSGQWWVREHPEIQGLVRCMVHIIGEEVREARRVQALADATRMQEIVGGLEQLAQRYQMRERIRRCLPPSSKATPVETKPALDLLIPSPGTATTVAAVTALSGLDVERAALGFAEESAEELEDEAAPGFESRTDAFAWSASCLLTGIFIGTFFTLCLFAPDRRALAHHLV
ncbi:uncharacterized protein B0H18DRAFT_1116300 [Fomitopsis serialis]|uniref:uncharacterized protein n=1 Tax=Fomitopsis serialis TaxID=139415 RepID=UPI002007BE85|nr:uncharacterized protein B0H18DRAFT_1116300 [Neoantrodia serialis]KAH9931502.1 hypothetical protein B0H18DRAFT_1116300 [Neoantrodia serialis]